MINAASVGLGWWSGELAKSIQGKSKKIKIVSCYSKSKKKRIDFSKKYKTDYHDSYKKILKDSKINAVILTTPHSLHAKHTIQALQAWKTCFSRKTNGNKIFRCKKNVFDCKEI